MEDLVKVVHIILEDGPPRGLVLSTSATCPRGKEPKSTIWGQEQNSDSSIIEHHVHRIQDSGFVLLGSPIGSHQFEAGKIEERIEAVRQITAHLPLIKDPQSEFVLLRSCFSLPKMMYLLRTINPSQHQALLATFDTVIRDSITQILGVGVNDQQWSQVPLPVTMGGLGLRSAVDHSAAAYVASVIAAEPLKERILIHGDKPCSLENALMLLSNKVGEVMGREDVEGVTQKVISLKVDLHLQLTLLDSLTELRDKARMASLSLSHTGDWLNVVPSHSLGLHLRPREFIVSILYRLGIPIYLSDGPCPACNNYSDKYGHHSISCGTQGERIARHTHLVDALYHTAVSASLAPVREERGLIPDSDARPGDILIPCWVGGRDAALDVTVINSLQAATIARAATEPGHALKVAWERKEEKARDYCAREGIVFVPLPVEALGGWHETARVHIKKIGRARARNTGKDENDAIRHLFQRLGVLVAKGNAALFLNRVPSFPQPEVDGV